MGFAGDAGVEYIAAGVGLGPVSASDLRRVHPDLTDRAVTYGRQQIRIDNADVGAFDRTPARYAYAFERRAGCGFLGKAAPPPPAPPPPRAPLAGGGGVRLGAPGAPRPPAPPRPIGPPLTCSVASAK